MNTSPEQHDEQIDKLVEITNLDPHKQRVAPGHIDTLLRFGQRIRVSQLSRTIYIGFVVLLCLLVLFLLVQHYPPFSARHVSSQHVPSPALTSSFVDASANNGVVYINTLDGRVAAYQAHNGQLLWRRQLASSGFLVPTAQVLYRFTSSAANGNIEALKASDGSLLWRQQVPLAGAFPLTVHDGVVYFNSHEGVVYALRESDGHILWQFASGNRAPLDGMLSEADNLTSILTYDGTVYILKTSDGSPIYHYTWQADQFYYYDWAPAIEQGMIYIDTDPSTLQARHVSDGSLAWQYHSNKPGLWSPIMENGIVYVSSPGGSMRALRAQDGSLLWQYTTAVTSPPTISDQVAYFILQNMEVVAVRTGDGSTLWRQPLSSPLDSQFPLFVADGIIYIDLDAPDTHVYALQASSGQLLWHHALSSAGPRYPPVVSNGVLYLGQDNRSIEAWRGSDGHFLWRYTSSAPLEWYPQVDDGILYAQPLNGTMDILRMSDGARLWRFGPEGH